MQRIFATPMKELRLEGLHQILNNPKKIVVTNHVNPDGDAMGSTLALQHALQKMGHEVAVVVPNDYPNFLKWLPQTENVVIADQNQPLANDLIAAAEVIFHLDYNALSRAANLEEALQNATAVKVMIDHHQQPEAWPDFIYSDTSCSSTCQMIYEFLEMLGLLDLLDTTIGTCIYTGLITDTGSFRYDATTSKTLHIAAHLLEIGVKPAPIFGHIYDSGSLDRLQMLGTVLKQMVVLPHKKAVILYLSTAQLYRHNYQKGDSEGFVNYGLSAKGVNLSAFLREDKEIIKISLRSKGDVDVNEIAREHFNGGGHKNAAGGSLHMSLEKAIDHTRAVLENADIFASPK